MAVNSAGLLKGLGDLHRARNATPCTNLWPELFQVMTQSSPESQSESLFSQSVRLPRLGQIDGRFQPRDGERERDREMKGEREALYLYELSVAGVTDWYNSARRPLLVSGLTRCSTPERNELMQDWIEIDWFERERETERKGDKELRRELRNSGAD